MGTFKLGKMTFGSLFKKPETVLYPIVTKEQPAGLKGHIVVDADLCILCGMCERNCTTDCISVNKKEQYWEINPYNCIQCGYCVTVCPKKCLHMDPNYTAAAPAQNAHRVDIHVQEKAKPAEKPAEKPAAAAKEPAAEAKTKKLPVAAEASAATTEKRDAELDKLLAQMSPEKAKIVESALAGR